MNFFLHLEAQINIPRSLLDHLNKNNFMRLQFLSFNVFIGFVQKD